MHFALPPPMQPLTTRSYQPFLITPHYILQELKETHSQIVSTLDSPETTLLHYKISICFQNFLTPRFDAELLIPAINPPPISWVTHCLETRLTNNPIPLPLYHIAYSITVDTPTVSQEYFTVFPPSSSFLIPPQQTTEPLFEILSTKTSENSSPLPHNVNVPYTDTSLEFLHDTACLITANKPTAPKECLTASPPLL